MGKEARNFQRKNGHGKRSGQDLVVSLSVIEVQTLVGVIETVLRNEPHDADERAQLQALAARLAATVPEAEW